MAEVIKLHPAADPNTVLSGAMDVYDSVVVLGWDTDGGFSGRSSLNLEIADALLLVELFKAAILSEAVD